MIKIKSMSSLRLFQTDWGIRTAPIYEIGSPLFKEVTIYLENRYGSGKAFTIKAKNTSFHNKYVQNATLNARVLKNFWFPASELLKGGKLELIMGPQPNCNWGTIDLPRSPKQIEK